METWVGQYFQQFRTSRGIGVRQAGRGLSSASVSRFERGLADISVNAAAKLMFNIGMDGNDLTDALRQHQRTFPRVLNDFVLGDRAQVKQNVTAYLAQGTLPEVLAALVQTACTWLDEPLNSPRQLGAHFEQELADRLGDPTNWYNLEEFLMVATLPFASSELKKLLWQRATALTGRQLGKQNYNLWLLGSLALANADPELHALIATDLSRILQDPTLVTFLNNVAPQLRALVALARGEDIAPVVSALKQIGARPLADFLLALQHQSHLGLPSHHHPHLKSTIPADWLLSLDEDLLTGPMLAKRRKQLGLTMKAVLGDWNLSTQSRFEQGRTQLGFLKTLTLLEKLALPFYAASMSTDQFSLFHRYRAELELMGRAPLAQQNREAILAVLSQFEAAITGLPRGLRLMLAKGLRTSLQWQNSPLFPEDDPVFASLTMEDQGEILSYFETITEVSALDAEVFGFAINSIRKKYYTALISAVMAKTAPNSEAATNMWESGTNYMYGAVYYDVQAAMPIVEDYFAKQTARVYAWQDYQRLTMIHTLRTVYFDDSPAVWAQAEDYLAAISELSPYDHNDVNDRWWLTTFRGKAKQRG